MAPTAAPRDKRHESDVASVSQPLWERLWWDQLFKPFVILIFPGWVLNVRQSVFAAVWVTFSISEELPLQSNIKIKCDQSARNPKQTAEPCWDASFLKMQQCKTVSESQRCLFILLSQCKSPHSFSSHLTTDFYNSTHQSERRKTFVCCLSMLALTLSQNQERSWFFLASWTILCEASE